MDTFSSPTGIIMAPGGTHGLAKYGDDKNLLVMFYNRAVEIPSESVKQGRRICRNEIYVTIQHPGEMLNKIDRPANDQDKVRFRDQWSRFVQDRTQIPEGTPIDLLFPNHPAVGENLKALGIFTIEQCASLSALAIDTIGRGGQEYVVRAQRYLDSANKGAAFHELQGKNDQLTQQVRILENQIKQLKEQLDMVMVRHNDPIRGAQQPPFVENFDVQSARINANHPTQEEAVKRSRGRPKKAAQTVEDVITDPFHNNPDIMATQGQDA